MVKSCYLFLVTFSRPLGRGLGLGLALGLGLLPGIYVCQCLHRYVNTKIYCILPHMERARVKVFPASPHQTGSMVAENCYLNALDRLGSWK